MLAQSEVLGKQAIAIQAGQVETLAKTVKDSSKQDRIVVEVYFGELLSSYNGGRKESGTIEQVEC